MHCRLEMTTSPSAYDDRETMKSKISDLITESLKHFATPLHSLASLARASLSPALALSHATVQQPHCIPPHSQHLDHYKVFKRQTGRTHRATRNIEILFEYRQAASKHTITMADAGEIAPNATFVHCTPYEPAQGQDHMLTRDTGFTYVKDNTLKTSHHNL